MKGLLITLFLLFVVGTYSIELNIPNNFAAQLAVNISDAFRQFSNVQLIVNVDAQRAFVQQNFPDKTTKTQWLILAPEGADPGSFQEKNFVLFTEDKTRQSKYPCSYTTTFGFHTGYFMAPGIFPPHWSQDGKIHIENYFSLSPDAKYIGQDIRGGVTVDLWSTGKDCLVFERTVPCYEFATVAASKGTVPSYFTAAHQRRPGSFEHDWVATNFWKTFTPQTKSISAPDNWLINCYNSENYIGVEPTRGFVSTPAGMDNFTVSLPPYGRPISKLGPVILNFKFAKGDVPTVRFLLEDGTSADGLQFTSENYRNPVTIFLQYLRSADTYFYITAFGGGYDETQPSSLRIVTCVNGTPGWGC